MLCLKMNAGYCSDMHCIIYNELSFFPVFKFKSSLIFSFFALVQTIKLTHSDSCFHVLLPSLYLCLTPE
jgi:hypothetical protein